MSDESRIVRALGTLSIFGPDQAAAFREHAGEVLEVLGPDVPTRLGRHIARWADLGDTGLRILTGNAGTGKTAVAQTYCRQLGGELPKTDDLVQVREGRWVAKDLSGLPNRHARRDALSSAVKLCKREQVLVCANEGVLRDGVEDLGGGALAGILNDALRQGSAEAGGIAIINVNRQRPTAPGLWEQLVDYVARESLWSGCNGCPYDFGCCPMRANAAALRKPEVQQGLRMLVQFASGEAVPTLREVLSVLAWSICAGLSCEEVKSQFRDKGAAAFTARHGYFALALGAGLPSRAIERSPLLAGMRSAGLGETADLQVDEWLRDSSSAPQSIQALAAVPEPREDISEARGTRVQLDLAGTRSQLDRVNTPVGTMTFHRLGETVATSEDTDKVEGGLEALVAGDAPILPLWRQRVFFEGSPALGGVEAAAGRLLSYRFFPDLLALARSVAARADTRLAMIDLVRGLNFLVTGFSSATEGLLIPDASCLFARNPGSFRPAAPSFIHSQVALERLELRVSDRGAVEDVLDVDAIEVELAVDRNEQLVLRIGPRMHEAIREAAAFEGPVGQGTAEMTDVHAFYSRLAAAVAPDQRLRVANPSSNPPALVAVTLPYLANV